MTIERQWIEIMKMEVPDAFTDNITFTPKVGFVDAQIKLMAMSGNSTWEEFIDRQFRMPVMCMHAIGALHVILAFDDYSLVPRAKAITQAKRREKLVPIEFLPDQDLPERPPENWASAMANRAFKRKVVQKIMEDLPAMMAASIPVDFSFTLDYDGSSCVTYTQREDHLERSECPRVQVRGPTSTAYKVCHYTQSETPNEAIPFRDRS
jgi:hypothetical protein